MSEVINGALNERVGLNAIKAELRAWRSQICATASRRDMMFVADQNGRAMPRATCPDIGEIGLDNCDMSEDMIQRSDPLRRDRHSDMSPDGWSHEDTLMNGDGYSDDIDCDDGDEDLVYSGSTTWWRRNDPNVEGSTFAVDAIYDNDLDELEIELMAELDDAPTEAALPADADNDYDLDELDAWAEHVAQVFDIKILEECALRAHLRDRYHGRQPANKGGSWIHRRPRQWVVARGHDAILQATPRRTPKAFCEAERLADILAEAAA